MDYIIEILMDMPEEEHLSGTRKVSRVVSLSMKKPIADQDPIPLMEQWLSNWQEEGK